ncbi:hypothetical protein H5410_004239 [Solanum commersonii]|uniref:Uncharacterized protein n=1 Tax=Solanum commersonii TaxID=4109 RepID=A0A9J6B7E4_SOLCO|nr:hypothetical protein H5410_004239 [Solanum commersonii]
MCSLRAKGSLDTNISINLKALGSKSTPTVLHGQGCFYRPRQRNQVVYGPQRLPGHARAIFYQPQQAMVLQVARVVECAHITPLLIQDQSLFANRANQLVEDTNIDDQEELDLELRL